MYYCDLFLTMTGNATQSGNALAPLQEGAKSDNYSPPNKIHKSFGSSTWICCVQGKTGVLVALKAGCSNKSQHKRTNRQAHTAVIEHNNRIKPGEECFLCGKYSQGTCEIECLSWSPGFVSTCVLCRLSHQVISTMFLFRDDKSSDPSWS